MTDIAAQAVGWRPSEEHARAGGAMTGCTNRALDVLGLMIAHQDAAPAERNVHRSLPCAGYAGGSHGGCERAASGL